MKLSTSRYQDFLPGRGTPIRSTVGYPRFRLSYQLAGQAILITPKRWMLAIGDQAQYRTAYTAMLDTHGLAAVTNELTALATAAGTDQLVLLCFCDLAAPRPDNWCHRRIFADWWQHHTGSQVPELTEPGPPTAELVLF